MLIGLSIKNYAIINHLQVDFERGFNVITGETGAGKSIIMGALGLILGQRADMGVAKNPEKKCIVEGRFNMVSTPSIEQFFKTNDLDFDIPVILRREIATGGKSRAFINDTPVPLNLIREIGVQLIDIHSQHANLELGKHSFQLSVIDWYGGFEKLVLKYFVYYQQLRQLEDELDKLNGLQAREKADYDYNIFQYKQLAEAALKLGEQEDLEQEQEMLNHSEEIKEGLAQVNLLLDGDEPSTLVKLREVVLVMNKVSKYMAGADDLSKRGESVYLELRDITDECNRMAETTEHDPDRLTFVNARLDTIFNLLQKHRVGSVDELLSIEEQLRQRTESVEQFDEQIERLQNEIAEIKAVVFEQAQKLRAARLKIIPALETEISGFLNVLGMPNATFSIGLIESETPSPTGIDQALFLFNANKGGKAEEINKVASGGEMSRLMLAIKTVVAKSKALPAIVFDEIDTGISGEIALKMGEMLKQMACYMQVINITHLPQIAARGEHHFLVYKTDGETNTETQMKKLDQDQRILEIAKMLSGENPPETAVSNAKSLMRGI